MPLNSEIQFHDISTCQTPTSDTHQEALRLIVIDKEAEKIVDKAKRKRGLHKKDDLLWFHYQLAVGLYLLLDQVKDDKLSRQAKPIFDDVYSQRE